ncbi:MAG: GNAT family N-acetyltransferase [Spirochaetales bacterium]|nr:GNAT family N-acetyltransferase [Spirochaetales bacterium]
MTHIVSNDVADAVEVLARDVFAHLVTLKMLALYRDACSVAVYRGADGWAIRTEVAAARVPWDRSAYPGVTTVTLIDGTDRAVMRRAADETPDGPTVFKIHDPDLVRRFDASARFRWVRSFVSYTTPSAPWTPPEPPAASVERHRDYQDEALSHFVANGYSETEIREHLRRGGVWFGVRREGRLAAVCIAFPNYGDVWEIGGVHTVSGQRRRGLARAVVCAAIGDLVRDGRRPRYQFRHDNDPSRALAESVGLIPTLTVAHYLRD